MKYIIIAFDSHGVEIQRDTYLSESGALSQCIHWSNMGVRFTIERVFPQ